ncbi:hypothetical protein [Rhodohalobacter sulfatireducens]|uniref:Uncharacterized protein n=1 Tax=Rhodohalobacter sulfatireducens TaxID=2911366 RepID=A0ABS9KJQ5_9BACT|nr:hypothetical protein [Rhodohalobacter sulfatireducens]MCG2591061.1 hypothetical protein [Rhodohalobacter sulfatireducens]
MSPEFSGSPVNLNMPQRVMDHSPKGMPLAEGCHAEPTPAGFSSLTGVFRSFACPEQVGGGPKEHRMY